MAELGMEVPAPGVLVTAAVRDVYPDGRVLAMFLVMVADGRFVMLPPDLAPGQTVTRQIQWSGSPGWNDLGLIGADTDGRLVLAPDFPGKWL